MSCIMKMLIWTKYSALIWLSDRPLGIKVLIFSFAECCSNSTTSCHWIVQNCKYVTSTELMIQPYPCEAWLTCDLHGERDRRKINDTGRGIWTGFWNNTSCPNKNRTLGNHNFWESIQINYIIITKKFIYFAIIRWKPHLIWFSR